MPRSVQLSKNLIKNDTDRLTLISGPCLLENEKLVRKVAQSLIKYTKKEKFNLVFKCSFDKANRSSHKTIRHKISLDKSIDILKNLKKDFKISITSDVHETFQVDKLAEFLDVIQIPAFLCRQTDLIKAAAQTKKIVNVKKGQFLSHKEVSNIINKIENENNKKILITERLSKAASSLRIAGFFIETHPNPETALSDGPNMVYLHKMPELLNAINKINKAAK